MSRLWGTAILLGLLITISGCSSLLKTPIPDNHPTTEFTTPTQTATRLPTQELKPATQTSPLPTASTSAEFENTRGVSVQAYPHYSIHASYDLSTQVVSIEQTIILYPALITNLQVLIFIAEPARMGNNFHLSVLKIDGLEPSRIEIDSGLLRVWPASTLPTDEPLSIWLSYEYLLRPGPSKLGYTQNASTFGDWYIFIPPHSDTTGSWLAYPRASVGEHLVYPIADFDVQLEIIDPPPDLILAASAIPVITEAGYHFQQSRSRNFTWSASTRFRVSKAVVGEISVASYYFPAHQAAGLAALETTVKALELFNELYGSYTQPHLAIVESEFLDGLEYHGLYFLGQEYYDTYDGTARTYLVTLAAHETAHQWFYGLVGNDSALDPWLDEALCTFSELLYYEKYHTELIDWWWNYRVMRFNPTGWVNGTIYEYPNFRQYVDAVYLRGTLWLADLRKVLGDEVFIEVLSRYINNHAFSIANAENFFSHIEIDNRQDLYDLTSIYFQAR